jgi:hypothetical protein
MLTRFELGSFFVVAERSIHTMAVEAGPVALEQ